MIKRLPRSNKSDPVVFAAGVWDRLADEIERLSNFSVAAPLHLEETLTGRALAMVGTDSKSVLVKISSNASGGGKYNGRVLNAPAANVSATGNLATADLGADPGSDNALILNEFENGLSTHGLTAGDVLTGLVLQTNTDGKTVVAVYGVTKATTTVVTSVDYDMSTPGSEILTKTTGTATVFAMGSTTTITVDTPEDCV